MLKSASVPSGTHEKWEVLTLLTQFAMAISAALFVLGRGTTVVSHAIWMFKPTNGPAHRRKMEK
jgi:hypothetical protein